MSKIEIIQIICSAFFYKPETASILLTVLYLYKCRQEMFEHKDVCSYFTLLNGLYASSMLSTLYLSLTDCGVDFFVESSESYRKPSSESHRGLLCHQTSWISSRLLVISSLQSFIVLSQAQATFSEVWPLADCVAFSVNPGEDCKCADLNWQASRDLC